jgi:microcystin-dependent protein
MPRGSNGTYTLPIAAFVPGGLIKSSDDNSNFSDIATAITQSLATTGVSAMTGPIKAAAGSLAAPSITFVGALTTGLYLSGANQIGVSVNGVQSMTFNNDTSTTWAGSATFNGILTATKGSIPVGFVGDFAGATAPPGWLLCFGQLVSTTTYALLFAQLSTTYGSGSGTFGIPDYRGRAGFGVDNMGGTAANRITTGGSGISGVTLGANGGVEVYTQLRTDLPNVAPTFSGTPGTVTVSGSGIGVGQFTGPATPASIILIQGSGSAGTASGPFTPAGTVQSLNGGVTQTAMDNMPPAIITNKIIYAGV